MKRDEIVESCKRNARFMLEVAGGCFEPQVGRAQHAKWAIDAALDSNWDEDRARKVVAAASVGDEIAHRAIVLAAYGFAAVGEPTSPTLATYLIEREMRPPAKKRGPKGFDNVARDDLLRFIARGMEAKGLSRTRNPATAGPSACSILAKVIRELKLADLSEKTLEDITA